MDKLLKEVNINRDSFQNNDVFFEILDVPTFCNLLWSTSREAQNCPKGDIKLAFNRHTGLITNVAFDPAKLDYHEDYENTLHHSPIFQQYAKFLAETLVERHELNGKDIIEIGCGKGRFLISLCELGNNRGVGFDPAYLPIEEHKSLRDRVQFIRDYYSQKYNDYKADLICCRHTLEHIQNPADLLEPLRRTIGDCDKTVVFFEVPNALHTFREMAIWDIIYEHCCYFAPCSLKQAFNNYGFEVREVTEVFGGQFLCLEALPAKEKPVYDTPEQKERIEALSRDIATFSAKFDSLINIWQGKLAEITRKRQKTVIWGAGSKGVTFLNLLKCENIIKYAVDINPRKHGMYVAGGGQLIVPPQFLQEYKPEVIVIANSIYQEEIQQYVTNLGLSPEFICVC